MSDLLHSGKVGILVGGGPALGINGVIAAATIEAIKDGAEWLMYRKRSTMTCPCPAQPHLRL
jgi:hypothetical protein